MNSPTPPDGTPSNESPGRILAVDDDPAVRRFVDHLLTKVGHQVDLADGVDGAIQLLATNRYDIAFVDLDMPGRTGLDLLDWIRAERIDIVPILLTGTTDINAAVGGIKRGAFDYLPKPADPVTIRWTASRAIGFVRTRRRERVLESAVAEWCSTFDACPDAMLVLNDDAQIVRANAAALGRTQPRANDPAGRPVEDVLAETVGRAVRDGMDRIRNRDALPTQKLLDPATGRHLLLSVNPIPHAGGPSPGAIVIARDVTELIEAKEGQARLYQQLLTAQEDERSRIARDLHDGIAQTVATLSIGLGMVADHSRPGVDQGRLRELSRMASDTLVEIRRLVQGLHPPVLDDLGLEAALRRLTDTFTKTHKVHAELVVAASVVRMPRDREAAIYRITQEALANVAKHARAMTVDVTLEVTADHAHLSISDDGRGFDPDDPARPPGGMGLSSMHERAERFGGRCQIDSHPRSGTTVRVEIPLSEAG